MGSWHEYDEYDEAPERDDREKLDDSRDELKQEKVEKSPESEYENERAVEKISLQERGIEKEWWNESIEEIHNPDLQEKRIEGAKKILEAEKELDRKLESGEISKSRYDHEKLVVLGRRKARFSVGADLESVDLSWDHLGDLSEQQRSLASEAAGNRTPERFRDQVEKTIREQGPDWVEEWADENLEKGKMPKEVHDQVSRSVRIARNKGYS